MSSAQVYSNTVSVASSVSGLSDSQPSSPSTTGTSIAELPRETYQRPAYLDPTNFLEGPLSDKPTTYVLLLSRGIECILTCKRFLCSRLRQLLARPGIIAAPGICDGLSARCAVEAGFDCLYQRRVLFLKPRLTHKYS